MVEKGILSLAVAWVIIFLGKMFIEPARKFDEIKGQLDGLVAEKDKNTLNKNLHILLQKFLVIFRPSGDFSKLSMEFIGWMFSCQDIVITNRSTTDKLSLEIILQIKMKPPFPQDELKLQELHAQTSMPIWQYSDGLPSPLNILPQDSKRGSLYFWTGPLMGQLAESSIIKNISEVMEKDGIFPIVNIIFRNLITGEVVTYDLKTLVETSNLR